MQHPPVIKVAFPPDGGEVGAVDRGQVGPGRLGPVRRSRTGPQDVSRLWCFIAADLGKGDTFARALLEFSNAYAEQNDRD